MVRPVDLSTAAEPVTSTDQPDNPLAWLADGTILLSTEGAGGGDLFAMNIDDDEPARPLLNARWQERGASVSPDGRWLAYESGRSGTLQLYVRSWPDLEGGTLVAEGEANLSFQSHPQWSADNGTLYYHEQNRIRAASIGTEDGFEVLSTRTLPFQVTGFLQDIHPDGRLLIAEFEGATQSDETIGASEQLIVFTGWFTELRARLGGGN